MKQNRVAMKAKDGSIVWIPQNKVNDWIEGQKRPSPRTAQDEAQARRLLAMLKG